MSTVAIPETQTSGTIKVELRRVIRATRQRVYEAWTRPEEIRNWLAPGAMAVTRAETNLREGGAYLFEMQGSVDGRPEDAERKVGVVGIYQALVPNELVSFTWRPDWNTEDESLVTVRLRDVEGGTEMLLTHERIGSKDTCTGYERGWTSCLEKLSGYLGQ